jgi:AcrR family transcriptional regulator
MSPRLASPTARRELIEAAARILVEEGSKPLTVRRLAAEVGTSTMSVYTQFGGMDELRRAVRIEGFSRLAQHLAAVPPLRDPVADLTAVGYAYCVNAIENPNLYRSMFLDAPLDSADTPAGAATFERLVATVERCIADGRFRRANSFRLATRFWAMAHGFVTLELAGLLTADDAVLDLSEMARDVCVGFGDDRDRAARSVRKGLKAMEQSAASA